MRPWMMCSLAMAVCAAAGWTAARADDGAPAPTGRPQTAEARSFFLGPVRFEWQFATAPQGDEAGPAVVEFAPAGEDVILSVVAAAEEGEAGYWLGLECAPAGGALRAQLGLAEGHGLVLDGIVPDSPAEKAGLKKFDVVTHADGKATTTVEALAEQIRGSEGKALELTILRGGKSQTVSVVPAERTEGVVIQVGHTGHEALRNILAARWGHPRHHHGHAGSSSAKPSGEKDAPKSSEGGCPHCKAGASSGCPHCKAGASGGSGAHGCPHCKVGASGGSSARGCPHCGRHRFGPLGFFLFRHLHGSRSAHHGCPHCSSHGHGTHHACCGHAGHFGRGPFWLRIMAHRCGRGHHGHHGCTHCGPHGPSAHHGSHGCPHCARHGGPHHGGPHHGHSGCPHCSKSSTCPHCGHGHGTAHGPGSVWSRLFAHRGFHGFHHFGHHGHHGCPHCGKSSGCPHYGRAPEGKSDAKPACPHCEKKPSATESAPAKPAAPTTEAKPGPSAAAGPHSPWHELLRHRFGPPGHFGPPGRRLVESEAKPQSAARPQIEVRPSVERPRSEVRIAEPAEAKPLAVEFARRVEAASTRHAAATAAPQAGPAAASKGYDLGQRLDDVEKRLDALQNAVDRLTGVLDKIASQK